MKNLFIVLTAFALLTACNNGSNPQSAQVNQQNEAARQQQKTDLQNQLTQVNADIEVDQDKLSKAKEFQVGRSESKRDDDIKAADIQLQNDQNKRDQIQKQLQGL